MVSAILRCVLETSLGPFSVQNLSSPLEPVSLTGQFTGSFGGIQVLRSHLPPMLRATYTASDFGGCVLVPALDTVQRMGFAVGLNQIAVRVPHPTPTRLLFYRVPFPEGP